MTQPLVFQQGLTNPSVLELLPGHSCGEHEAIDPRSSGENHLLKNPWTGTGELLGQYTSFPVSVRRCRSGS